MVHAVLLAAFTDSWFGTVLSPVCASLQEMGLNLSDCDLAESTCSLIIQCFDVMCIGVVWINKIWCHTYSVFRNDLIYTFLSHQLRFLGHLLRSDHTLYALYEPTHGKTHHGRSCTNYITYIQFITGHELSELNKLAQNQEYWRQLVVECADPQPPDWKKMLYIIFGMSYS